jgi:hypothetical protein
MRLRDLYEDLLKNGDLFDMYSNMTGDFEQDRKSFSKQQADLESISSNLETDIDDEFIN